MKKNIIKLLFVIPIICVWLWALVVEPYFGLYIERINLFLPKWDLKLDGIKIALVSDFHAGIGPHEDWRIKQVIEATNKENPDVILLLGDYVNGGFFQSKMDMGKLSKYFSEFKAKYGVYAILGNHDCMFNEHKIKQMIRNANITFLENFNARISTPNGDFYIAAIGDALSQSYSYKVSMKDIPKDVPIIFLSHTPDVISEVPKNACVMFSGHTHGGQIILPFIGPLASNLKREKNMVSGLYKRYDRILYLSGGLGASRIPMRFMCPPRIDLLTIYKEN